MKTFMYVLCWFGCCLFIFTCGIVGGQDIEVVEVVHYNDVCASNQAEIVTIAEQETAVLPCYSNLPEHDYQVIWTGPGSKLLAVNDKLTQSGRRVSIVQPSQGHFNLHIKNVVRDDQGLYECMINSQPAVVKPVFLVVQVSPEIKTHSTRDQTVFEGADVELQCVSSGIPPPTVTWYKVLDFYEDKVQKLETNDEEGIYIDEEKEKCVISNMTFSKAGTYRCRADNRVGTGEIFTFFVKCKIIPSFTGPLIENVTVQSGDVALLPCAVENLSWYKVLWKRSYSTVSSGDDVYWGDRFGIRRTTSEAWNLRIKPAYSWDSGTYRCTLELAANPTKQKIVNLIVTPNPQ